MSEKKAVVIVLMKAIALQDILSYLDFDKVRVAAILRFGGDNKFFEVGDEQVPIYSFQSIEKLLVDGEKFLWLIGGWPTNGVADIWKMARFLIDEGVPRGNILNLVISQHLSRTWIGNLRYVEKNPVDYFVTGISYTEVGIDLNHIKEARGAILASSNQDLRQGYFTAKHIFAHHSAEQGNPIKFVLIGLAPYSLRYDNSLSFSVCTRNLQHFFALKNFPLETAHDKLLLSIMSDKVETIVSSTTEKNADLNFIKSKRQFNKDIEQRLIANWRAELDNVTKDFRPETVKINLDILEKYIQLCLDNGAKPVAVTLPFAPIIRRHYPEDLIRDFRRAISQFEKTHDFLFADLFDLPLGYDCFYNMSHLNLKGAAASTEALTEKLHEKNILPLTK